MIKKYRKKPVTIEAIQWTGTREFYPCKPDIFAKTYEGVTE